MNFARAGRVRDTLSATPRRPSLPPQAYASCPDSVDSKRDACMVVRSLAAQLAEKSAPFAAALRAAVRADPTQASHFFPRPLVLPPQNERRRCEARRLLPAICYGVAEARRRLLQAPGGAAAETPETILARLLLGPLGAPGVRESFGPAPVVIVFDAVQRLRCAPSALQELIDTFTSFGTNAEEERPRRVGALLRQLVQGTPPWVRFIFTVQSDGADGVRVLQAVGDLVVRRVAAAAQGRNLPLTTTTAAQASPERCSRACALAYSAP